KATQFVHRPQAGVWVSKHDVTIEPFPGRSDRVKARWTVGSGPVAKPGSYSVRRAGVVTLDGSGSTDPAGSITDYA
ncbi:MAG: hypothetical protein ABJA81_00355, partial [Nocardioidaceae bacterium]